MFKWGDGQLPVIFCVQYFVLKVLIQVACDDLGEQLSCLQNTPLQLNIERSRLTGSVQ